MTDKVIINSFGNITIPQSIRKKCGIDGNVLMSVSNRVSPRGEQEIVIKRYITDDTIIAKYRYWIEIVSDILQCPVSLVNDNKILLVSSKDKTLDYAGRNITINPFLCKKLKDVKKFLYLGDSEGKLDFIREGTVAVSAIFHLLEDGNFYAVSLYKVSGNDHWRQGEFRNKCLIVQGIFSSIL